MSVDDPDKKPLNQTRFGVPTGHANERQMLDSRNDTFGIRTIIKRNADGSETMCRTRAGMPRFFTNEVPQEEEPVSPVLFLETGHTQYPTAANINQYYGVGSGQGRWWFKVETSAAWLGYISSNTGTQSDGDNSRLFNKYGGATPPPGSTLYDGMVSPATSVTKTPDSSMIDAMIAKRKAMESCPASMFSGKMRLFMQSRYGALLDESIVCDATFTVTVDGVQISNLGGVGWGLFTTSDYRYFVLHFSGSSVTVYPLKARKSVSSLVESLRSNLVNFATDDEREKPEAYILANSEFDTANAVTYNNAIPTTTPLMYGWSFKFDGSKADIISIATDGVGLNTYFVSTHYSLNISHVKNGSVDEFGFEAETVSVENWRDGRGSYHIFVPDYANGGRMVLFTAGVSEKIIGDGKFHCFYKKNGELVTAKYSFGGASSNYPWYYENDADWPGGTDHYASGYNNFAKVKGRRVATYKTFSGYSEGNESFVIGTTQYGGSYQKGTLYVETISHGMGCAAPPQVRGMAEYTVTLSAYGLGYPIEGWDGTYPEPYASDTYVYKYQYLKWTEESLGRMLDSYYATETRVFHTAVIPFFDCCAVYVYERDARNSGYVDVLRRHQTNYSTTSGSRACYGINYNPHGVVLCTIPDFVGNDSYAPSSPGSSGDAPPDENFSKYLGPVLYSCGVHHFKGVTNATPTEPEETLVDFFTVSMLYPFVDTQVWTSVNYGGNEVIQPVYKPDQYRRWTGWV